MALTDDEASSVRAYLGFSDGFRDLDTRLESQILNLTAGAEARVRALLTRIGEIDTKLQSAALANLDLERAEDVTFLGPEQLVALRGQGRMLCRRLGQVFFLEPRADYFDEGGGDMGGLIQLG